METLVREPMHAQLSTPHTHEQQKSTSLVPYIAEMLGTFGLVFAGCGALVINTVSGGQITHVGVGLVFGLVITVMIYAFGHLSGAHLNPAVTLAFVLVRHFPLRRLVGQAAALAIGATVGLEALFAGPISGASMNPARSLGPALVSFTWTDQWVYFVAPFLGAVAAAYTYRWLREAHQTNAPMMEHATPIHRRTSMTDTDTSVPTTFVLSYRVLFLCTHNSSRSQMAEGLLHARGGQHFQVFSAGTHPRHVHPLAIRVMAELDIDISERAGHTAKGIETFADQPPMDLVVTVCDEAAEECPYFPNARRQVHWGFPDPSRATGTEEEQLNVFRHVRDLIAARITAFVDGHEMSSIPQDRQEARTHQRTTTEGKAQ